jgi:hypothetical protein
MGTSIITRVGLIAVLAAGLLSLLNQPQRVQAACNGHTLAVGVDRIKAYHTTDNDHNVFNNRDEVYFVGAGAVTDPSGVTEIKLPRISPDGKENYFKFKDGRDYDPFYRDVSGYWCLGDGETIALSVLVREQDNGQLGAIAKAVGTAATATAAIITGEPTLAEIAKKQAEDAAHTLFQSLAEDGDDTIGGFTLAITNQGGALSYEWRPAQDSFMTRYGSTDGVRYGRITDDTGATFEGWGDGAHYTWNVSVWEP